MRVRQPCLLGEAAGFCIWCGPFFESYPPENPPFDESCTREAMPDPFSIATGSIGLVGVGGKAVTTCQALYSLWQDVKDVPERISRLLESIQIMTLVLAAIERNACEFRARYEDGDHVISNTVKVSLQAKNDLEILVKDLGRDIHAERGIKKLAARVKVVLKEDQLSKYELRLQNTFGLLTLAQQLYTHAQQFQIM
jgi:hypothetical protein